jgi:hypothetical protein
VLDTETTFSVGTAVITFYMAKSKNVPTTDIAHIEDEEVIGVYCHTMAYHSFGNVSVMQQTPIHWFFILYSLLESVKTRCRKRAVLLHLNIFRNLQAKVLDMLRAHLAWGPIYCRALGRGIIGSFIYKDIYKKKVVSRMLSVHVIPYECMCTNLSNASKRIYILLDYFPGVARVFIYPNLIVMCVPSLTDNLYAPWRYITHSSAELHTVTSSH